jgi:hypothetical protein
MQKPQNQQEQYRTPHGEWPLLLHPNHLGLGLLAQHHNV